jgi:hypothetical protein
LAEAARRLSRTALRGAWSAAGSEVTPDSMMLRSAEADPHVIEHAAQLETEASNIAT